MTSTFIIAGPAAALFETEEDAENVTEEGQAVESDVPNPVLPEPNHMLWAAISFFLLWALMKFVLLPPILDGRSARDEKVRSNREAVDRAQDSADGAKNEREAQLADARAEADEIIEAARAQADEHREKVMAAANAQAATARESASSGLEEQTSSVIDSMRDEVGDIATTAASAVLGKSVDRSSVQSAIDAALDGGN